MALSGTATTNVNINIPGLGSVPIAIQWNLSGWSRIYTKLLQEAPRAFYDWRIDVQDEVGDIIVAAIRNIIWNVPAAGKIQPMDYTGFLASSLEKYITEAGAMVRVFPTAPYAFIMDTQGLPPGTFPAPNRASVDRAAGGRRLQGVRGELRDFDANSFGNVPIDLVMWCQRKMGLDALSTYRVLSAIANNGVEPQHYMARGFAAAEPIVRNHIDARARNDVPRIIRRLLA